MKNNFFILIFTPAFFSYLIIDFFSLNYSGVIISILIFIFLSVYSTFYLARSILFFWFTCVLFPEFPRSILDLYVSLNIGDVEYNVISSVKFGPLTLTNIFIFYFLFIAILKVKRVHRYAVLTIPFLLLMFSISLMSTILDLQDRTFFSFPQLITSSKYYIFTLVFSLISILVLNENSNKAIVVDLLARLIALIPPILGLRAVFFIVSDFALKKPSLDLMTQPLLSICAMYFYVFTRNKHFTIYSNPLIFSLVLISLLTTSRSVMAIVLLSLFFLLMLVFLIKSKVDDKLSSLKKCGRIVIYLSVTLLTLLVSISITNERLYDFIMWKASEFTFDSNSTPSGSALVRKHEIINIANDANKNLYVLLFGKGFGSHFNFEYSPPPLNEKLDEKSFPLKEIENGEYYNPHTFIATLLLRFGILGLGLYLLIPIFTSILFMRKSIPLAILCVLLIYNYYFRFEFQLLMVLMFYMALLVPKHYFKSA